MSPRFLVWLGGVNLLIAGAAEPWWLWFPCLVAGWVFICVAMGSKSSRKEEEAETEFDQDRPTWDDYRGNRPWP